jgi:hypothetical protein
MTHFGYIRNYESTLRLLAARGHRVHLCFTNAEKLGEGVLAERLAKDCPNISYSNPFKRPADLWLDLTRLNRMLIDYLRYLHPRYRDAVKLRERVAERLPGKIVGLFRLPGLRGQGFIRLVERFLRAVETALPLSPEILEKVRSQNPTVLLVTPLVELASEQTDYLKCARSLGVKTGLTVYSWDNLTNKGVVKVLPDMITVWNEAQKAEAAELHGADPSRVVVTGAPSYEHWFQWKPSTGREEFCRRAGLRPDRPFILYTCSSPFIAPEETGFVRRWIEGLRGSPDPRLREVGVLVRPHPQNAVQWEGVTLEELGNVAVWPRTGINPVDAATRSVYFDSIHHCAAVMGVNTSALIESGIVGRPVYTMTSEDFAGTQTGTLHFHHLVNVEGGLLHVAKDPEENHRQLAETLADGDGAGRQPRPFIETFVRPHGGAKPASEHLVEAIERLGAEPSATPARAPWWASPLRGLLAAAALLLMVLSLLKDRRKENLRKKTRMVSIWFSAAFLRPFKAAVNVVLGAITRQSYVRWFVSTQILTRTPPETSAWTEIWAVREIKTRVLPLQGVKTPIIIGPWFSEVGFEVLYWIPFVRWLKTNFLTKENELIVVSRGGARHWYGDITDKYVDILDCFSPEEFRAKNEARMKKGKQKQRNITELDNEIIDYVKRTMWLGDVRVIHPSLMYKMFNPYWKGFVPPTFIQALTTFERMSGVEDARVLARLPEDYVAVKFYFSYAFPDTPENRAFIASVVERLAQKTDVVMLNTDFTIDDHSDFSTASRGRVHTLADLMTPSDNLRVQTLAVSRAKAFVGTYGGFSYIAPFCGVNALSFYSDPTQFNSHHHELAQRIYSRNGFGSLTLLHVRDAGLVDLVFGPAGAGAIRTLSAKGSVS